MPGNVPPVADERAGLLAFLAQQRDVIRIAAYGLTDEQARLAPSASELSVGGLIKHVAATERGWIDTVLQRPSPSADESAYETNFHMGPDETLADVFRFQDEVAAETEKVIAAIEDLGQPVPVPQDAPGSRRTSRPGRCAGCCCTSSRRRPATPATPTSCASRSTAPPPSP